jgi:O-antigen ligase
MAKPLTYFFFGITPLLVFFSAMAMTPLLFILLLLALAPFSIAHVRSAFHALAADRNLCIVLALLLLWPCVSAFWSLAPAVTLKAWVSVALVCFAGALAFKATKAESPLPPRVILGMTIAIALACLLLLLEQLPEGGIIRLVAEHMGGDAARFMGKTVNRGLCALAVIIWPVSYGLGLIGQRKLAAALVVLLGLGLAVMGSLSAQLGFVAGLVTMLLVRALPRLIPLLLLVAVPLLFFTMPFLTMWALNQPFTINNLAELRDMSSGRILIWPALIEAGSGHDWLGWGMKTSNLLVIPQETLDFIGILATPLHPHHSMLQVFLELGLVGLALVSAALALMLRRLGAAFPARHPAQAAAYATMIAYLAAGFSSFSILQNWWVALPWIVLLIWRHLVILTGQPRLP